MRICVTGGAGFIGSHLVDALIAEGHQVMSVDMLEEQVHHGKKPDYLNPKCRYIWDDCGRLDPRELAGVDVIFHLAALVGVGQSMDYPHKYFLQNTVSTVSFMNRVSLALQKPKKIIVASSMSIYGEGREAFGASEAWPVRPASNYALTKYDQEQIVLINCQALGIPAVACRFFNVYGSRQALTNPYTGVCAIFASALLKGDSPTVYEDGLQTRDFVHVSDTVSGLIGAMKSDGCDGGAVNIGTGEKVTIKYVAERLSQEITGGRVQAHITNQRRHGDIRHCWSDISRAKDQLGYAPKYNFDSGVGELVRWVKSQTR